MKRWNVSLGIFLGICISFPASAQLLRDLHYLYNPSYFYTPNTLPSDTTLFSPFDNLKKGEFTYRVEAGTGFSSYLGGLSSSFISPMVSYRASNKLFITAGGKFSSNSLLQNSFTPTHGPQAVGLPFSGNPVEAFAVANYKVNDRLSLYGTGSFGKNQLFLSPYTGINSGDYKNISFGMDYKFSDSFRIGASFGVNQGPNLGWGNSSYGNSRFFGHSPFFPY